MAKEDFKKRPGFQSKKNVIAGRNPVTEALKAHDLIDKILLFKNAAGESVHEIRELAKQQNVPVQYVPVEKLNSVTHVQHQGVVAFKSAVVYHNLEDVINRVNSAGETPLLLMLDGVTDVRNIGGIARSAVCYGAQAIIIPDKNVGALNEDAVKASAGALEKLEVCRVNSLLKAIDTLHLSGIKVFASEAKAAKKIYELNWKEPCCIVMGSEEKSIQPYLTKAADEHFSIPMKGDFDSLNVSVATGIILYEAMKQRMQPPTPKGEL